jgi:L-threonylcarbamoyladenylate synthase
MSEAAGKETAVIRVDPEQPDPEAIARAAAIIRAGGLVAFPTETVYGLGANALDAEAARGIYIAKGRDPSDPCIVHIAHLREIERVAAVRPRAVATLAGAWWPGPLSLVLPKTAAVPDVVTAGQPTVAVRMPDHPVALALIRAAGVPIAAPSANLFTHTSPTTAEHVLADLAGRIDLVLDAGPTKVGVESTILDLTRTPPALLRPGGIPLEWLRGLLGEVVVGGGHGGTVAPGMMAKHYAPRAEVIFARGPREQALRELEDRAQQLLAAGKRIGLLLPEDDLAEIAAPGALRYSLGLANDLAEAARRLFAGLRWLEEQGAAAILARDLGEQGLGLAIRDRLTRAAGKGSGPA